MNYLNRRVNCIYRAIDLISPVQSMADIGTDHGLIAKEIINRYPKMTMIISDVSPASLKKAKQLFSKEKQDCIHVRLGDGLQVLSVDEVELVLIAGMGGRLITKILERDIDHVFLKSHPYLFLQTPQHPDVLRKYLFQRGYRILFDHIIQDNHHFYHFMGAQVITSSTLRPKELPYIQQWLGLEGDLPLFENNNTKNKYAIHLIERKKEIIHSIRLHTPQQEETIEKLNDEITILTGYLREVR